MRIILLKAKWSHFLKPKALHTIPSLSGRLPTILYFLKAQHGAAWIVAVHEGNGLGSDFISRLTVSALRHCGPINRGLGGAGEAYRKIALHGKSCEVRFSCCRRFGACNAKIGVDWWSGASRSLGGYPSLPAAAAFADGPYGGFFCRPRNAFCMPAP